MIEDEASEATSRFRFTRRTYAAIGLVIIVVGSVFVYAFFDGFRCTFDKIFRFLQSKICDFTDSFNDADFITTDGGQNDIELGFLLCRGSPAARRTSVERKRPSRTHGRCRIRKNSSPG